jgi:hypothetical protein
MTEIPNQVHELLSKKYNIIDVISFLDFDLDFNKLKSRLLSLRKTEFDVNDRIIIEHQDTDFYFEYCEVGINLLNFFNTVTDVDIPKFVFLFYTNHFGIKKEIDRLCKDPHDRPSVIESFVSKLHYNSAEYNIIDLSIDAISYQCLCLMNTTRSHRNAMFNSIKDISNKNLITAITINGT